MSLQVITWCTGRCRKSMTIAFAEKTKANDKRWPNSFCSWQMRWRKYRQILSNCAIRNNHTVIYRHDGGGYMNRFHHLASDVNTSQKGALHCVIKQKAPMHPPRPFAYRESPIRKFTADSPGGLSGQAFMGLLPLATNSANHNPIFMTVHWES